MPNSKRRQQKVESDLQELRGLIPSLSGVGGGVSQTEIMQEAAKYIDQLQNNLVCHIRTHGYPDQMKRTAASSSSSSSSSGKNINDRISSNSGNSGSMFDDGDSIKKNLESYIVGSSQRWPNK